MNVVPFSTASGPDEASPAQITAADASQQMVDIKHKLEEAATQIETLQRGLSTQAELEQLLKQGRIHLQELRTRLQQVTVERDRVQAELADTKRAHEGEVDQLTRQMDDLRQELQSAAAERDRVTAQLAEEEAAHKRFAEERADERSTFKRLLDEASSTQREMTQELNEQRQQLDTLREAAMRAQSFAREIMRAHEAATAAVPTPSEDNRPA